MAGEFSRFLNILNDRIFFVFLRFIRTLTNNNLNFVVIKKNCYRHVFKSDEPFYYVYIHSDVYLHYLLIYREIDSPLIRYSLIISRNHSTPFDSERSIRPVINSTRTNIRTAFMIKTDVVKLWKRFLSVTNVFNIVVGIGTFRI